MNAPAKRLDAGAPAQAGAAGGGRRPLMPPPFPAVALQLIRQMQNPDVSAAEVGRLIELDPSLTASLLRLVNSPFFGMRRQLANVSEAVMVLGMSAVRRMVLSLAVAAPMREGNIDPECARDQWHHTVSCAALARRLVLNDLAAAELAFTAGLLHDMGKVHLMQLHGTRYQTLHAQHAGADLRALEAQHFGQAHDTLGADLLESWGLPQAIVDAARAHHAAAPIGGLSTVQQAVWVANRLACGTTDAGQITLWGASGLAPITQALQEARAEIATLASLLNA